MKAEAAYEIAKPATRALSFEAKFFLLLLSYFGWQVLLRAVTSTTADLDESEQLVMTQKLQWGYGPQPPLYTWLQILFFELFGASIGALSLLKNLLLFCTYAFTYLSARVLTRDRVLAVTAAVSLLFVPQIAWESQRDLTHSVLVTTLAAATLFVLLRLSQKPQSRWYFAFGLCAGLGALANYNYLAFFTGLMLAALSVRSLRVVLLDYRAGLALVLGVGLALPHVIWACGHHDVVFATAHKFNIQQSSAWTHTVVAGLTRLSIAVLTHVGPLLAVFVILCWKHFRLPARGSGSVWWGEATGLPRRATLARVWHLMRGTAGEPAREDARPTGNTNLTHYPAWSLVDNDQTQLVWRSYLFALSGLVLAVLCFKVTGFKDRWFQPIFVSAPVLVVATLRDRLTWERIKAVLYLGAAVAAAVSVAMPTRIRLAERLNRHELLNAPFDKLAAELREPLFKSGLIFAENLWLGGNLRLFFPEKTISTPDLPDFSPADHPGECVLVWDATRAAEPPQKLTDYVNSLGNIVLNSAEPPRYVEAVLKYYGAKKMRLGMIAGRCKRSDSIAQSRSPTRINASESTSRGRGNTSSGTSRAQIVTPAVRPDKSPAFASSPPAN